MFAVLRGLKGNGRLAEGGNGAGVGLRMYEGICESRCMPTRSFPCHAKSASTFGIHQNVFRGDASSSSRRKDVFKRHWAPC